MTTGFIDHLQTGTHAARPAATAVPQGTLWSCTTHSLVYQSDGATWSTWATLGGGGGSVDTDVIWDAKGDLAGGTGADAAARLPVGANDTVLTADSTQATGLKWAAAAAGGDLRYLASLPSGAMQREYLFTGSVESWTTSAGTLSSTSDRLQLTHTSAAVGEEPAGSADVADGELELEFRTTAMTGSAAVLFRLDDASNFYAVIFQPGIAAALYKFVAGTPTSLVTFGYNAASAWGPVQLLIRYVSTQIEIYINGTLVLLHYDATFSTGRVGIRADNSTIQVDSVRVYSSPVRTGNVRVEGL
jgi:hypothetical protein